MYVDTARFLVCQEGAVPALADCPSAEYTDGEFKGGTRLAVRGGQNVPFLNKGRGQSCRFAHGPYSGSGWGAKCTVR